MHPAGDRPSILILGIGNILLCDEGVGVRVVEAVQRSSLPAHIEVVDGGTAGADLLETISGRDKVIVVDAMETDCPPGTVLKLSPDDLQSQPGTTVSLHEVNLLETLAMADQLGERPNEVVIFGIQPERIGPGLELSETLMNRLEDITQLVRQEALARNV